MSFDADTIACAALTQKSDPDRFAATMALPVPLRARLFPLWALNTEVARAPWVTQEPIIAEMRLQWWRDALEEIGAGGFVRRHEVVTPLATLLNQSHVALLDAMIDARRLDLEKTPFEDEDALWAYLEATTGNLLWAAALLLGAQAADEPPVRQAARAIALANWMRALPELEARGKSPMPDGRPQSLARLAQTGLNGLRGQGALSQAARSALLTGFLARPILRQITRKPGDVAQNRLHPAPLTRNLTLVKARLLGRI